jgi:hypothetical protein
MIIDFQTSALSEFSKYVLEIIKLCLISRQNQKCVINIFYNRVALAKTLINGEADKITVPCITDSNL